MTPKEKAVLLIDEFMNIQGLQFWQAQLCALILCDNVIDVAPHDKSIAGSMYLTIHEFYKEVKKQIEDL